MKLSLALAALLVAPCAGEQKVHTSPAASKSLGAADEACQAAAAELPALPLEPERVEPPRPSFQGRPLLPPDRPGDSVSEAQGCLSAPEHTPSLGARYPAPAQQPRDAVRVNPLATGLLVTHDLAHPCCVQATVQAAVEGSAVRVTEVLAGSTCACQCASRLRTAIALSPGRYSVTVVVRGPGAEERTAFSGGTALPGK
ncbi:MAG TPA: hypothetical protein VND93_25150 [Myxococcales bacterium]|nr:hypothetical protein [Myxococcales bacterium]